MPLIDELKRRNVVRVAVAYLAGAWLLIQIADVLFPATGLGDQAMTNTLIVLAIGFFPSLILAWFFELTPSGIKRDSDIGKELPLRSNTTFDRVVIIILVIAVGFFAVDKFVLDPDRDAREVELVRQQAVKEALKEAQQSTSRDQSIAVLAFADLSPAGDQEYFSDGIAEEILNVLSSIKGLRVISRSTAFTFKDSNLSLKEIGEKLDVAYILEGSVRRAAEKIRITVQLVDTRTDAHIWSKNYDRQFGDIFAIQDDIAASIVDQTKISLLTSLPGVTRIDEGAYEKYLKAHYIVQTNNGLQYREAQELLNEILAVEPDYIPAINTLARLYYRIPKTDSISQEDNFAEIRALAHRVIEIAPDGVDSMIWQGWMAFEDGNFEEAARFYEAGAKLDPVNTSLLRVVGVLLAQVGQPRDAIAFGNTLIERDPSCVVCRWNLARSYTQVGEYEAAVATLNTTLDWAPPEQEFHARIGRIWLKAGDPQKALEAFQQEPSPRFKQRGLILALYDLGQHEESAALLKQSSELFNQLDLALIYMWTEQSEQAFNLLQSMAINGDRQSLGWLAESGFGARISSNPRWAEFLEEHDLIRAPTDPIDFSFLLQEDAQE